MGTIYKPMFCTLLIDIVYEPSLNGKSSINVHNIGF